MIQEEIKAYLKDNLKVQVVTHWEEDNRGLEESHGLEVNLLLEDEIIASDWFTLPMLDNCDEEEEE